MTPSGRSNTDEARRLAREVVERDDTTLREALLADAVGHLADQLDDLKLQMEKGLRAALDEIGS